MIAVLFVKNPIRKLPFPLCRKADTAHWYPFSFCGLFVFVRSFWKCVLILCNASAKKMCISFYRRHAQSASHKMLVRIFEQNFCTDKVKIRRRAFVRQDFFTQYVQNSAEKMCISFYRRHAQSASHKMLVRIFEQNFCTDKAKIRRRTFVRQDFFTQYVQNSAEKTCISFYRDTL